jgi:hypothetical protein
VEIAIIGAAGKILCGVKIPENLTVENCAQRYLDIWRDLADEL